MELAEVKKHFENAEFVETVSFNEKRKVDLDSIWADCDLDFWSIEKETGYIFCLGSKKRGFAKILTTKEPSFSITKDQLRQLTDPKVKEWFPEAFKVKLEVGKWYKRIWKDGDRDLFLISDFIDNKFFTGEFFRNNERLEEGVGDRFKSIKDERYFEIEATNEEVFEALKIEAVRRGFVKGVFFRSPVSGDNYKFTNIYFTKATDKAWSENGGVIFEKGNWATIIQTITKSEAEKLLNKKIID